MTTLGLLMAGLGAAGLLLVNLPASAQMSNDTSTFNGEVAATCSINGLNSDYALSWASGSGYLSGGYHSFSVDANSRVKLVVNQQIITEPAGYTPAYRRALMRQVIGGEASNPVFSNGPGIDSVALFLTDTPGTATAEVRMFVGPDPPPGDYSYQVIITCLL